MQDNLLIMGLIAGAIIFFLWRWYQGKTSSKLYGSGEEIVVYNNTSLELSVDGKPFRPDQHIKAPKGSVAYRDRGSMFGVLGQPNVVEITAKNSSGKEPSISNNTGVDVFYTITSLDGKMIYRDSVKSFEVTNLNISPEKLVDAILITGVFEPFHLGTNKDIMISSVFN